MVNYIPDGKGGHVWFVMEHRTETIRRDENFQAKGRLSTLSFRNEGNIPWLIDKAHVLYPGKTYVWTNEHASVEACTVQVQKYNVIDQYWKGLTTTITDDKGNEVETTITACPLISIRRVRPYPRRIENWDELKAFYREPENFI